MTMDTVVKEEQVAERSLGPNDRCDSCGGQAYVVISGSTGELSFCAHHYTKIMNTATGTEAMQKFAFNTIDEREALIKRESANL
jgi:hypothetical protein